MLGNMTVGRTAVQGIRRLRQGNVGHSQPLALRVSHNMAGKSMTSGGLNATSRHRITTHTPESDFKHRLLFLGAPGVGKGTYSSRVSKALEIPTVSSGNLLRQEIKEGTELGKEVKALMATGGLLPDQMIIDMMSSTLLSDELSHGFILDGFPRTIPQAEMLEELVPIGGVINLTIREDVIVAKLLSRWECENCGENYNFAHIVDDEVNMEPLLPKREGLCDECGYRLVQRTDDNEETIKHRLNVYKEETLPLVEYYSDKGKLKTFNITGGPVELMPKLLALIEQ